MIDPTECFVAPVATAKSMTLILPRASYEYRSLIVPGGEKPVLICLDDYPRIGRFLAFECQENEAWKGLHIPGVRIELDETSLYDSEGHYTPKGSMLRFADKLGLRAQFEGTAPTGGTAVILEGLPPCSPHMTACFLKWQIVLGAGDAKQVLWQVDATPTAS